MAALYKRCDRSAQAGSSLLVWWQSGVSLAGGATAAVGAFQDRTLVSLPVGVVMSALGIAATTTGGALVYFDHTS